ncbi:MAG: hypothetical protein Q9164_007734 [Protoblastenia rupestris]
MSLRNLLPGAVAAAVGVFTGIYIFGPTFKEEAEQKEQDQRVDFKTQHSSEPTSTATVLDSATSFTTSKTDAIPTAVASAQDHVRKTEERVANAGGSTTIPNNTARWAEVQNGQFAVPTQTFKWSDVPLNGYNSDGNDQDHYGRKG